MNRFSLFRACSSLRSSSSSSLSLVRSFHSSRVSRFGIPYSSSPQVDVPPVISSMWSVKSSMPRVPLDIAFIDAKGAPTPEPLKNQADQIQFSTQSSTLENGLRVVSATLGVPSSSNLSSLAVVVNTGSRDETPSSAGFTSLFGLRAQLFHSTVDTTQIKQYRTLEEHAIKYFANQSRESIIFGGSSFKEFTPVLAKSLSEVVYKPAFLADEVAHVIENQQYLLEQLSERPDITLKESLYEAAYSGVGLGRSQFGAGSSAHVDGTSLVGFHEAYFTPSRSTLFGFNIDHASLLELARDNFANITFANSSSEAAASRQQSAYTGGDLRFHETGASTTHAAIAFQGLQWSDKDIYALLVLRAILGTSASSAAESLVTEHPTRFNSLYPATTTKSSNSLSRVSTSLFAANPWLDSASSFLDLFSDSSLFGIVASAPSSKSGDLYSAVKSVLLGLRKPLVEGELNRAKSAVRSSFTFPDTDTQFKLAALQAAYTGAPLAPEAAIAAVNAVTEADIARVVSRLFASKPTVAAKGDILAFPRYEQIVNDFKN